VFLFDEPLSNLDAKLRVQTRAELTKLHQRLQTTFIYVTHDQIEAMTMATRIAVIKDGILQQVGTPEELYFRPDNVFVAGFIGSPSMNFVEGTLTGEGAALAFEADSLRIELPLERASQLASFAGRVVTLGIRPEDMHDPGFLPARVRGVPVTARVDVTEMMGNEKFLHVLVGKNSLLARVDPRTRARVGQDMELRLDIDRLHVFDPATQLAVAKIELPEELLELPQAPDSGSTPADGEGS
jgi:multiple sugar transport system ATP-binding protein